MALEWGRFGINVNAICPGYIDTEINHHHWQTEQGQKLMNMLPRKRVGQPQDLDALLVMLASDQSHFINGAVIAVPTTALRSGAMACWTAFALLNSAWLHRHPEVSATDWANWLGVATGTGALLMWLALGTPASVLLLHPGFAQSAFCGVRGHRAGLGVAGHHPLERGQPAAFGQPVRAADRQRDGLRAGVFFVLDGHWPGLAQLAAAVLFTLGILGIDQGTPMKFEIPAVKKLVFEMTIPIRWGDMDAMNIGVPKEIKNHEYRVGLTPARCAKLVAARPQKVLVQPVPVNRIGLTRCRSTRPPVRRCEMVADAAESLRAPR
jgi:hypothetical protein